MSLIPSFPQFVSFEGIKDEDETYLKSLIYDTREYYVELPWDVEAEWSNWECEEDEECEIRESEVPQSINEPPHHQGPPGYPPAQQLIGLPVYVSSESLPRPPGSALQTSHPAAVRPPFQTIPASNVPHGIQIIPPPPYGSKPIDCRINDDYRQISLDKQHNLGKKKNYYASSDQSFHQEECVPYSTEHMLYPSTIPQVMPPHGMIPYHTIPQTTVTMSHPYQQYGPPFYTLPHQYHPGTAIYATVYTSNSMHTPPFVYTQNYHHIPNEEIDDQTNICATEIVDDSSAENEMWATRESYDYDRTIVTSPNNVTSSYDLPNLDQGDINEEVIKMHNRPDYENSDVMFESIEEKSNRTDNLPDIVQSSQTNVNFNYETQESDEVFTQVEEEDTYVFSPPENNALNESHIENETSPIPPPIIENNAPSTAPVWEQQKSWSSLFKAKSSHYNSESCRTSEEVNSQSVNSESIVPPEMSVVASFPGSSNNSVSINVSDAKLGEILLSTHLNNQPSPIQPRGLINRGNWCYINATLQALVACPPFYNLLRGLPSVGGLKSGPSTKPVLDSMVEFVHEFKELPPEYRNNKQTGKPVLKKDLDIGTSFEPQYVYKMLECIKLDSFKGRQEDAEEFLTCLLNSLHEEMVASINMANNKTSTLKNGDVSATNGDVNHHVEDGNCEDEDWQVMGPNKKSCVTRTANLAKSPISEIFGGQMRSALRPSGETLSCILQSFFSLQLDIQSEKVCTVSDALEGLVCKESIQGYTCAKTNKEVEASKRITLEELPVVLILHLKRFVYDKNGGCLKLNKKISFPIDLELSKELLSTSVKSKYNPNERTYRLFAVVYHDGAEAAKGHYVTDVYHAALGTWLRTDDNNIHPISENLLTKHHANRVPYLLYYRRCDTILPSTSV